MLNRFTLGFLLLGQLCLVGCDEITGSLTLQLERPSRICHRRRRMADGRPGKR